MGMELQRNFKNGALSGGVGAKCKSGKGGMSLNFA